MPICPNCKAEYNKGEEICTICNCRFEENLNCSNGAETFLVSVNDGIELAMVEGQLRTENIPYFLKNKETGSYMKVLMGFSVFGVDVYVPSNYISEAKNILNLESLNVQKASSENIDENNFDQLPEHEVEDNPRRFYVMVFLSILFSPLLLVALILWFLWMGAVKIFKLLNK